VGDGKFEVSFRVNGTRQVVVKIAAFGHLRKKIDQLCLIIPNIVKREGLRGQKSAGTAQEQGGGGEKEQKT
jgi:hypothetical protein